MVHGLEAAVCLFSGSIGIKGPMFLVQSFCFKLYDLIILSQNTQAPTIPAAHLMLKQQFASEYYFCAPLL